MKKNKIFLLILILLFTTKTFANNSFLESAFIAYENDSIYGKDQYYTNGEQLSFITKHNIDFNNNNLFYNYSFGIGQKMYTASDINIKVPEPNDHPYAGYLYFFLNKNIYKKSGSINIFGASVAFTGKMSLGEFTQKKIHDMIGSDEPQGWDTQLDNELLFMLTYSNITELYKHTFINNLNYNIISKFTTNIGTPFTNIKQYFELRIGLNTYNDFITNNLETTILGITNKIDLNYYFFIGTGLTASAYNTFLDGNINNRRKDVNKKSFIYEINTGITFLIKKFYLKYSTTFLSKEFEAQEKGQILFTLQGGLLF